MPFLIFKSWGHEQRQNLVEERPCSKLSGLVCDLPESRLSHWWSAVLNFKKQPHDLDFLLLLLRQTVLVDILQQFVKILCVFRLEEREIFRLVLQILALAHFLFLHEEASWSALGGHGCWGSCQLASRGADRDVTCRWRKHLRKTKS